jgi:hypothetical protein
MVKAEVTAGKPPLDRSAERCSLAPAALIAAAFPVARVVDPLKEAPLHCLELSPS